MITVKKNLGRKCVLSLAMFVVLLIISLSGSCQQPQRPQPITPTCYHHMVQNVIWCRGIDCNGHYYFYQLTRNQCEYCGYPY